MNDIKMDLTEIGWEVVDWIHLAQTGPMVGSCEPGNEPSSLIKGREFFE
jgi:hypothetical protein